MTADGPVVVDAGHGGEGRAGGSTGNRVVGPAGTLEKHVTLALARHLRAALEASGERAMLTRDSDQNVSLRQRALLARTLGAKAFVSLHFNGSGAQGSEVWIHDDAGAGSSALAEALLRRISGATGNPPRGVYRGPMAVLDPRYHRPGTAAALAEVSYLTDPVEEARLQSPGYLQRIAHAIAAAIGDASATHARFDVWHEVPLVHQLTGMSCWAAAAAMLVGWRDCIDIDPEEVALGTGRWEAYRDGLEPGDVETLAAAWNLLIEPPRAYDAASLRELMEAKGPLWVGEASPGLHVITLAGIYGDGTPDRTFVRVADPWPVGRGERYTISFRELSRRLTAATDIWGVEAQVLHTGGRNNRP